MAARHDADPRALTRAKRKSMKKTRRGTGLTKRVEHALEALIWDSGVTTLKGAAEAAGLTDRALRMALRKGPVLAHYKAELATLRDGERARNLATLVEIRDDDRLKDTAAGATARIKAVQVLEDDPDRRPGVNVHVDARHQVVTPGYVIDLTEPMNEDRLKKIWKEAGSTHRNPLPGEDENIELTCSSTGRLVDVPAGRREDDDEG